MQPFLISTNQASCCSWDRVHPEVEGSFLAGSDWKLRWLDSAKIECPPLRDARSHYRKNSKAMNATANDSKSSKKIMTKATSARTHMVLGPDDENLMLMRFCRSAVTLGASKRCHRTALPLTVCLTSVRFKHADETFFLARNVRERSMKKKHHAGLFLSFFRQGRNRFPFFPTQFLGPVCKRWSFNLEFC